MDFDNGSFLVAKNLAQIEDISFVAISNELAIVFSNDTANKKFSFDPESVIGKNITEVFDGMKLYLDLFLSAVKSKQSKKISNALILSRNPEAFDLCLIPVVDGLFVFIKRTMLQEALTPQIINKKEMLGNLIATVCNKFNNILGAINGNALILRTSSETLPDKPVKDEIAGYLDLIDKSVSKASELVSQLNSYSVKVNISLKEVDLNDIIRNLYISYLSKLEPEITVDAEILSTRSMVKVDPSLIQTTLKDICENAVHSMTVMRGSENAHDGGILSLTLDHVETDKAYRMLHPKAIKSSYWIVTVSDTGVGIKKEHLKKVLTPFFSEGKASLNPDGLGLSVGNNIIQENGGFIEIESEVGKGTKILVFLPEHKAHESKKEISGPGNFLLRSGNSTVIAGAANTLRETTGKPNTILIVDDDIIMRRVAEVVLKKTGYNVIVASEGDEAINI